MKRYQTDIECMEGVITITTGWQTDGTIKVTTHGHHGVYNHWKLECLFNSLHRLTKKTTSTWKHFLLYLSLVREIHPRTGGFPSQRASNVESVFMSLYNIPTKLRCHFYPYSCINSVYLRNSDLFSISKMILQWICMITIRNIFVEMHTGVLWGCYWWWGTYTDFVPSGT